MVHALSEYKPQFADVNTAPLEDTYGDVGTASMEDTCDVVVMAAKVVSDKANPIITNATTAVFIESFRFDATTAVVIGSFRFAMITPPTPIPCAAKCHLCSKS